MNAWTPAQLKAEFEYRRIEHLGLMCEDRDPTTEQAAAADKWARQAVDKLRGNTEKNFQAMIDFKNTL